MTTELFTLPDAPVISIEILHHLLHVTWRHTETGGLPLLHSAELTSPEGQRPLAQPEPLRAAVAYAVTVRGCNVLGCAEALRSFVAPQAQQAARVADLSAEVGCTWRLPGARRLGGGRPLGPCK